MTLLSIAGLAILSVGILILFKHRTSKIAKVLLGIGIICVLTDKVLPAFYMYGKSQNKVLIGVIIGAMCLYFAYILYKFFVNAFKETNEAETTKSAENN